MQDLDSGHEHLTALRIDLSDGNTAAKRSNPTFLVLGQLSCWLERKSAHQRLRDGAEMQQ